MSRSTRDVDCASLAARAAARRRSTFCLGVSPGFEPEEEELEPDLVDLAPGSLYGVADGLAALELTYGPVAVNLVASAAERDILAGSDCCVVLTRHPCSNFSKQHGCTAL